MDWSISRLPLRIIASVAQLDRDPAVAVRSAEIHVDVCWRKEQNLISNPVFLAIQCSDSPGNEIGSSLRQRRFHGREIQDHDALFANGKDRLRSLLESQGGDHENLVECLELTNIHHIQLGEVKVRWEQTSSWEHERLKTV